MSKIAFVVGGGLSVLGIGGLLYWRAKRSTSAPNQTPNETSKVPVYYAGLRQGTFDTELGGGWVLKDVRDLRVTPIDTDRDVHVGNIVTLFLQNRNAPVKVFGARVINISGDDFDGQWVTGSPSGGPQMAAFRGAHIFSFH